MIRFLYFTDPHMKGKTPSARTDDYSAAIEKKVRYGLELGHELKVDFFKCGGDFMDSAYTSPKYVSRIGDLLQEGLRDKKMFYILGNHDVLGMNPKTISDTSFGLFAQFCKNMIPLSSAPTLYTFNGQSVYLSGVHSYSQLDKEYTDEHGVVHPRARDYVIEEEYDAPVVHTVHGYLSPKAILDDIPHTTIDEMRHTKATVTLTGHEHTGFPVTRIDHGWVYNPGALGRVFASHTEMNRMPRYALVEIRGIGDATITPIPCPVAEPGHLVFDRSKLDEQKAKEEMLAQASGHIQEILSKISVQGVDVFRIMNSLKPKIEEDVYKSVMKRLEEKQWSMR